MPNYNVTKHTKFVTIKNRIKTNLICELGPGRPHPQVRGTGKRYLRVYIQIRFRHACHETRDRQSRSLVSGQDEGWGEVKVLLKF